MVPSTFLKLRGGPRLSLLLRQVVGNYAEAMVAEADPDVRISFGGFDRYWMRVFFRGDFYEPELYRLFSRSQRLRELCLIDGGANIGFWSAILTSERFGASRAVALEASPSTYADLARTAKLCGDRFVTEHRALSKTVGHVEFEVGLSHESRHIATNAGASTVRIEATTVDDIVTRHGFDPTRLLVKLDVEGAELDCVLGGSKAFESGALWVYEDHGKDPTSRLTGDLLAHGAACWFITDEGTLTRVSSADEASRFKRDPVRGYNFLCIEKSKVPAVAGTFGFPA